MPEIIFTPASDLGFSLLEGRYILFDSLPSLFESLAPGVDFCSLRVCYTRSEFISVRQDVLQPVSSKFDRGAMITVYHRGGYGYAATGDLSASGLQEALAQAKTWAAICAKYAVADFSNIRFPDVKGLYESPSPVSNRHYSRREIIEALLTESSVCRIDSRIVDWQASLWRTESDHLYLSTSGSAESLSALSA